MNDELKELIGRAMHIAYEAAGIECGWSTQDSCKVNYEDLPANNRFCMDASVEAAADVFAAWLEEKTVVNCTIEEVNYSSDVLKELAKELRP